jgi:hypothetical protein
MATRGNGQEQQQDSGVPFNPCDRRIHSVRLPQTAIRRRRPVKFARILNSTHDAERRTDRFRGAMTNFCIARIGESARSEIVHRTVWIYCVVVRIKPDGIVRLMERVNNLHVTHRHSR